VCTLGDKSLLVTHADGVRLSKAIIRVCV